jgi:exodeoxyribonuclease VII large subunit
VPPGVRLSGRSNRAVPDIDAPLTVSALTQRIGAAIEDLGPLLVRGELAQVKVAPSGHLYATLKDAGAVIGLVMWRSQLVRNGALPREGEQVVVRGALSVYAPRGQYQLVATRIAAQGQGDLAARFEALKAKLLAEGLFDEDGKLPLPFLPRAVGLATAAGSAALADLLHSIRSRFPRMPVVLAPCLVQGAGAPAQIVSALQRLDRHPEVDVIVVGRGGGSAEDLWAFNEESVVRAIAACRTPVVSAVGHETDHTLSDLAADVRAKTPTAAGELVVPSAAECEERLLVGRSRLDGALDALLARVQARLAALASHRALAGPGHQLALRRQRLDELSQRLEEQADGLLLELRSRLGVVTLRLDHAGPGPRLAQARQRLAEGQRALERASTRTLDQHGQRLAAAAGRLAALSPLAVIARGYSVVRREGALVVRRIDQVRPGERIEARVSDGWIQATVSGSRAQALDEPAVGGPAATRPAKPPP